MFVWIVITFLLIVIIWVICLNNELDKKSKELNIRENEIKEQLREVLDSLK